MYNTNNLLVSKTINQQSQAIRNRWPGFEVVSSTNKLKATGHLQPTARSIVYKVQIDYKLDKYPDIIVLEPKLVPNFNNEKPQHLYPQDKLCLFRPIYRQFKFSDLISETIIPWISLWLYHYEVWHLTGEWLGGGEHPDKTQP